MNFRITIERMGFGQDTNLYYGDRDVTLEAWDKFVDDALPGEILTLRNPSGEIMSSYKPMAKSYGEE